MDLSLLLLLLLLATIPVIIILLVVYIRDKNKEPLALLIKLFLSGFLSCILVLVISNAIGFLPFMQGTLAEKSFLDVLLYSFIGVALIEETCKWIMTYFLGYHHKEFDEVYDIIVYAIFVSLGFAFVENIIYVIQTANIKTALLRAISAVPSHACDAVFMGYYLSVAKQYALRKKQDKEKMYLILSVIIPTLLHGIYDFCLMSNISSLVIVFIVFVVYLYTFSLMKLLKISHNNRKIKFKNRYCNKCGKAVTGEFCSNCGQRQV